MTVTAVIPHWNHCELLSELLENLRSQALDEVIVADNGSTDNSAEVAERAGARVLRLGRNLGFAAAVNRGIETAQTDWVAILNNDVTLEPGWLATLLEAAERQDAWFATGKILRADDRSTLDGAFDEISRGACAWRCGADRSDAPLWNQAGRIRFAPMTAALFRRKLFDEIGMLDETFESYLEDVDFGIRCALAGRDGIYVPSAVAVHRGSSTLGAWTSDTVRWISRSQVLLTAKYFRGQSKWPILVGQLLWGVLASRHGQALSYVKGKISGLRAARHYRPVLRHETGFRTVIDASERKILELQQASGFDWYWRAYFWLLRL
jgi:GT2 family glycosyltransferase